MTHRDGALWMIAEALTRLAVVAERVYPAPPDRAAMIPAPETAFSRPTLKELTAWEQDHARQHRDSL